MFTDFEFDGEKASDYGLIVGSFNNSGVETVSSGADLSFSQVKASGSNQFNLYEAQYENPYTTTFQVIKNPCNCNSQDDMYFSTIEVSSIQRWLCRKYGYYKFKTNDENYRGIYWKGTFNTKQINLNGQIVGLELTLNTDAPYAYLEEIIIEIDCSKVTNEQPISFDVYDVSDEEGYIYPNVKITMLEDVTDEKGLRLENSMSNKVTVIKNCKSGEVININGEHQIITTTSTLKSRQLSKNFNYLFPRIVNTYKENKNTFTCNRKCLITISYSPIRKVGI